MRRTQSAGDVRILGDYRNERGRRDLGLRDVVGFIAEAEILDWVAMAHELRGSIFRRSQGARTHSATTGPTSSGSAAWASRRRRTTTTGCTWRHCAGQFSWMR